MNNELTVRQLAEQIIDSQNYISSVIRIELEKITSETGIKINHVYVSLDKVNSINGRVYDYLPTVELDWSIQYE